MLTLWLCIFKKYGYFIVIPLFLLHNIGGLLVHLEIFTLTLLHFVTCIVTKYEKYINESLQLTS